jgi:hypothetical protein
MKTILIIAIVSALAAYLGYRWGTYSERNGIAIGFYKESPETRTNSQPPEFYVHGIPAPSVEERLRNMVLVGAPLLDSTKDARDIIHWVKKVFEENDASGRPLNVDMRISDERPTEERNTMAQWSDPNPDKATWPQIRRINIYDYLTYIAQASGLSFTTTPDRVIIEEKK